jgi:hypothetical protein
MDCRTFSKTVVAGIGGLLLLSAAGAVKAAPSSSTNGIFSSEPLVAQAEATPAAPFNSVNLRGGGTTGGSVPGGACAGFTCNASGGTCSCTTFTGTLTGTGYGKVTTTIAITENDNDITLVGAGGSCFPAIGTATLTTPGAKPSIAVLGLTGALCQFESGTAFTVNGNFGYAQEQATGGTNKFATSFGTGNLAFMESVDQEASGVLPATVSAVGTLQLKH